MQKNIDPTDHNQANICRKNFKTIKSDIFKINKCLCLQKQGQLP